MTASASIGRKHPQKRSDVGLPYRTIPTIRLKGSHFKFHPKIKDT